MMNVSGPVQASHLTTSRRDLRIRRSIGLPLQRGPPNPGTTIVHILNKDSFQLRTKQYESVQRPFLTQVATCIARLAAVIVQLWDFYCGGSRDTALQLKARRGHCLCMPHSPTVVGLALEFPPHSLP